MFNLSAGDQHHRVIRVGTFCRRDDVGRHKTGLAAGEREVVGEDHRIAGIAFLDAGIGDCMLALEAFPGDAGDAGHRMAHFVEDFADMAVLPVQTELAGDLLDDPQVLLGLAGGGDCLAPHLYRAVGIGEGAVLFRKGAGWQDDVGKIGRFGEENVLHHQMLERRQCFPRMVGVGVGHRRVFAHHVHAANSAGLDRMHHFDDGQTGRCVERTCGQMPGLLEAPAHFVIDDFLVVGVHHRDQPRIGGALHIVLAPQGVQAGTGSADLPGHQGQRDQAAGVVGAVDMLRNAHAPEDHRGFGTGIKPCDFPDCFGFNAADRCHRLGRVAFDIAAQLIETDRAAGDEVLVDQAFGHDHMHHRVEQGDIGVSLELQEVIGHPCHVRAARIADDELCAALDRVLDPGRRHRVIDGGIGADDQHQLGLGHIHHRIRDRARADAFEQGDDRGGVAKPGAMVDVVAAETGANQLLEQISLFIAALGRTEAGQRTLAMLVTDVPELAACELERFFPTRFAENVEHMLGVHREIAGLRHILAPDQRHRQPMRMVGVIEAVAALDAKPCMVGRAVAPVDEEDLVVLDVIGQLAADAAERAERIHLFVRDDQRDFACRHQGTRRTGLHAFAAGHASRSAHRVVHVEDDLGLIAAEGHADHVIDLLVATGAQTARALDAGVQIDRNRRVREIRLGLNPGLEARCTHSPLGGPLVELVVAGVQVLAFGHFGHISEQQFEHQLLRLQRARAVGRDDHARRWRAAAGRCQYALAVDFDHAGAAVADAVQARLVAKAGNFHAFAVGDLDQGFV